MISHLGDIDSMFLSSIEIDNIYDSYTGLMHA